MKRSRLFLIIMFGGLISTASHADLMISPLRVVFEDRARSATVTLMNVSSRTSSYRVSWRWYKMNEAGEYKEVPVTERHGVVDFRKSVRYSPRQITVAPNAKQKVRLSLRRPENMPDGEYLAHLAFTRLAKTSAPEPIEGEGARMQLDINVEFSIPVIIRQGKHESTAKIETLQFQGPTKGRAFGSVNVVLSHEQKYSTYGKLIVYEGDERVGYLNNVSLFPEVKQREFDVILDKKPSSRSNLKLVYKGEQEYRGTTLAEQMVP